MALSRLATVAVSAHSATALVDACTRATRPRAQNVLADAYHPNESRAVLIPFTLATECNRASLQLLVGSCG